MDDDVDVAWGPKNLGANAFKLNYGANVSPIDPVELDFCLIHKIHSETVVWYNMQWVVVVFYYSVEVSVLKKLIPSEYPCFVFQGMFPSSSQKEVQEPSHWTQMRMFSLS